jgi:hypothetical protein
LISTTLIYLAVYSALISDKYYKKAWDQFIKVTVSHTYLHSVCKSHIEVIRYIKILRYGILIKMPQSDLRMKG